MVLYIPSFAQVIGSWKFTHCQVIYNISTGPLFTHVGTDCAAHCLSEKLTTAEAQH